MGKECQPPSCSAGQPAGTRGRRSAHASCCSGRGKGHAGGMCCRMGSVLLCFISTDAGGIGYRGLTQGSPHPNSFRLYFRRWHAGPSSSLQTTPECPVLLSEVQSGVLHLLGLISGVRRGGKEIPTLSLVVEMDLLPRRLRLSKNCLSSPVPAPGPHLVLLGRIKVSSSTPVSVARSRSERECVLFFGTLLVTLSPRPSLP